ncbi:hypothetical protein BST61_g259 [Cercospora zeina]
MLKEAWRGRGGQKLVSGPLTSTEGSRIATGKSPEAEDNQQVRITRPVATYVPLSEANIFAMHVSLVSGPSANDCAT